MREVCILTGSTPASLSFKGQVTKHTIVKRSIVLQFLYILDSFLKDLEACIEMYLEALKKNLVRRVIILSFTYNIKYNCTDKICITVTLNTESQYFFKDTNPVKSVTKLKGPSSTGKAFQTLVFVVEIHIAYCSNQIE